MNQQSEVKLHFLDYWRVIRMRMGLILLTFFLVMVTAAVYVVFLPREYFSKVTMEIKPDNTRGIDSLTMGGGVRADPQFITTQFQILRKRQILDPVIEKLDLARRLSPPGQLMPLSWVARVLERSMVVQEQRNTTLIEVGVYNTDRELAAQIANTIAIVYRDIRIEEQRANVRTTLDEMKDELDKKRKEVQELYTEAAKLRQEKQVIDPDPESSNVLITTTDRPLSINEQLVAEKRVVVDQLKTQLNSIEALKPEQLMEALQTLGMQNQSVVNNLPAYQAANAEEARLLGAGLGENHPRVKQLRAQRDVYWQTLQEQLDSIKGAQRTRLSIEESGLAELETRLKDLRDAYRTDKDKTSPYVEAKARYLNARNLLYGIEQRYNAAKFEQVLTTIPVIIREKAEASAFGPAKPNIPTYIVVACVIGLVVGVGLAFFIEYLDTSVKSIEDIERYLGLPVLAVIPKEVAILIKQKRDSADAEAYRILKANIEFNQTDREANTYTLVSGGPGEGKSTTLTNLAYTYARAGANVLVVDADLRRPSQHRYFDVETPLGLADYLQGRASLEEVIKPTRLENLSFIASGTLPQDDAGILNGARMTELIAKMKSRYDIVFFDSPPILGVSDASLLVAEVDNTIMVVQHRRFPRGMLQRVKQAVNHVGGNLIGVVLNNVDTKQDDSYSYYSTYNEYYTPKRERAAVKPAGAGATAGAGAGGKSDEDIDY